MNQKEFNEKMKGKVAVIDFDSLAQIQADIIDKIVKDRPGSVAVVSMLDITMAFAMLDAKLYEAVNDDKEEAE